FWRVQNREERGGDVANVHQRPPGSAVAAYEDISGRVRVTHQAVDDEIAAQAWRQAVGGGIAEIRRAKALVGQLGDVLLDPHLRLAVGRDRVERGFFVD